MRLPSPCRPSVTWTLAFLLWAALLWHLSNGPLPGHPGPSIPGLDKVAHFAYYSGGAFLLSAALFLRSRSEPNWPALFVAVVFLVSLVGLLDELHQSWSPGRTGNDPGDWLADAYGALAGALVFRRLHRLLL